MIFTERTITVVNDSATINKPLILYRGDKNVELKITIAESQFKFRNTDASNVIETTDASYAQLVINTPYGSPIFSDVAATKNGAVIFVITEAMIDEIREVGAYEIQIRLLDDNKQSRASIPPVSNAIEIREPIAIEDGSAVDSNAVNAAKVNRALTTTSAPLEAFDSQGNYIKNNWGDGDPITDAALNKIEVGIDGVNKKIGNNRSEVVQARGDFNTLNDRHNASELAIEQIKNLINIKINWTDKKCIQSTGVETNEELRSISNYIFCYNAGKVKFNAENNNEYINGISFYDKDYIYLQGVSNVNQDEYEVEVPKNAFYLRLSILTSNKKASFVEFLGNMYYNTIMQNIDDIKNLQLYKKDANFTVTNYALLFEYIYENYYYNNGNLEKDPITQRNATDLVVLDRENNLYCSNNGSVDAVFFNKSKTYISTKQFYDGAPILKEDFPQEAYFVAFTYYRNTVIGDSFFVSKMNTGINKFMGSTIKKEKGVRPVINILLSDSEEQIFTKLCDAWYTQDCDVYFEYGTYNFDSIFELTKTKYQWNTAYELPIGSNCRYYFNNSTLIGTYTGTDKNVADNASLMGSHRDSGSYELHDGNLVANNIVYAVHDEASGLQRPYIRKYHNMNMEYHKGNNTQYLSKCIGGGTGIHGKCTIDKCTFFTDNDGADVGYHGHTQDSIESTFRLTITDSYFSKRVSLDQLSTNEVGQVVYCNNSSSQEITHADNKWNIKSWCNEVRNS